MLMFCNPVNIHCLLGESYCLHLQGIRWNQVERTAREFHKEIDLKWAEEQSTRAETKTDLEKSVFAEEDAFQDQHYLLVSLAQSILSELLLRPVSEPGGGTL
jgi:hypothetical protein